MLEIGDVIYGVNTGFGGNVKFLIPSAEVATHQQGLLRHLYCGTGPTLSAEVVRGAILLRANALAKGFSAVRPIVLDRLLELLNAYIEQRGNNHFGHLNRACFCLRGALRRLL